VPDVGFINDSTWKLVLFSLLRLGPNSPKISPSLIFKARSHFTEYSFGAFLLFFWRVGKIWSSVLYIAFFSCLKKNCLLVARLLQKCVATMIVWLRDASEYCSRWFLYTYECASTDKKSPSIGHQSRSFLAKKVPKVYCFSSLISQVFLHKIMRINISKSPPPLPYFFPAYVHFDPK